MNNIYIISDLRFCDKNVATELNMSVVEYNNMIINKWNEVIDNDTPVYCFGVFCDSATTRKEISEIISKLKGKIYLIPHGQKRFTREEWHSWGIDYIWYDVGFTWNNSPIGALQFPAENGVFIDSAYKIVSSAFKPTQVYQDKILSMEAKYWDYTPLSLDNIPNIIQNLKTFEEMEG